jgi:type I restriction enzyme S subunit
MPTDMQKTLPKGWKWVKLGDVAAKEKFAIRMGPFGSQLKKHELVNKGIKVLWIENIVNNKFEWLDNKCITIDKFQVLKGFQVKPNDILTTTMGTIGRACVVPENIGKAIISSHLLKISPDLHIANPEFISRYLSSDFCQKYFDKSSHGIVMKGLNTTIIKSLPVPFPPLSTQHKILEILEEADDLRKLRQQADEKMKDLIPSLFVQMFGDPSTNPKGWEVKKLGELCEIRSGGTPSRAKNEYWGGDIPWLGSTVCKDMPVYRAEEYITKAGIENSSAKIFKPKTTLIALVGATIGRTALLKFKTTTNQNIAGLFPLDTNILIPEFVFYFSQTLYPQFLKLGEEKFRMANLGFIRGLEIFLPPFSLQQEFAKLVEDIEAEKARQAESRKNLDELFNSLMQRAFSGELVA